MDTTQNQFSLGDEVVYFDERGKRQEGIFQGLCKEVLGCCGCCGVVESVRDHGTVRDHVRIPALQLLILPVRLVPCEPTDISIVREDDWWTATCEYHGMLGSVRASDDPLGFFPRSGHWAVRAHFPDQQLSFYTNTKTHRTCQVRNIKTHRTRQVRSAGEIWT